MADNITRCPKCATAFRISDAHLKSAKGIVRCGFCLSLFNGRDHLETKTPKSAPTPSATAAATKTPTQPAAKPQRARAVSAQPTPQERSSATSAPAASLFEYQQSYQGTLEDYDPGDSDDEVEEDEAWALELLKDDTDLNVQFKKVVPVPPKPESDSLTADEPEQPSGDPVDDTLSVPASPPPAAVSPTRADTGLKDPHPAQEQLPPSAETPDTPPPEAIEPHQAPPQSRQSTPAPAELAEAPTKTAPEPQPKGKPLDRDTLKNMLAAIEPDSLEVAFQENKPWYQRLLWPGLVLGALLVLSAQVAWLEFDRLSRVEPYRSVYAVLCRALNCDLPELIDRRLIQTSNLIVRSHPEQADALAIDVILQNNAAFEQSFPVLQLTFTDLKGEPVAIRRFEPEQYLGGELAGQNQMPVRQPIHIAMEIADPGPSAVNYNVVIVD